MHRIDTSAKKISAELAFGVGTLQDPDSTGVAAHQPVRAKSRQGAPSRHLAVRHFRSTISDFRFEAVTITCARVEGLAVALFVGVLTGSRVVFNPFAEVAEGIPRTPSWSNRPRTATAALEKLVLRHQAWIYNIAVRMVFQPHDAEEVTQEVLVKVITRLSTFKRESKFRTWLYRIAANHVLNMKRRSAETQVTTFAAYGAAIDTTPDLDLPDPTSVPVALPLLVEEAKHSCTMRLLLCLDRQQRLVSTLGAILGAAMPLPARCWR